MEPSSGLLCTWNGHIFSYASVRRYNMCKIKCYTNDQLIKTCTPLYDTYLNVGCWKTRKKKVPSMLQYNLHTVYKCITLQFTYSDILFTFAPMGFWKLFCDFINLKQYCSLQSSLQLTLYSGRHITDQTSLIKVGTEIEQYQDQIFCLHCRVSAEYNPRAQRKMS